MGKKLKMKKLPPMTKEEVRSFRKSLEDNTRQAFKQFAKAKQISWQKAKSIILD